MKRAKADGALAREEARAAKAEVLSLKAAAASAAKEGAKEAKEAKELREAAKAYSAEVNRPLVRVGLLTLPPTLYP